MPRIEGCINSQGRPERHDDVIGEEILLPTNSASNPSIAYIGGIRRGQRTDRQTARNHRYSATNKLCNIIYPISTSNNLLLLIFYS